MTTIRSAANCVRRVNARSCRTCELCAGRIAGSRTRSGRSSRRIWHTNGAEPTPARSAAHAKSIARALQAARQAVLAMRANDEIGDDAFHRIEEELDWLEMADGSRDS